MLAAINPPSPADMAAAAAAARELLELRYSTTLFRLGTAELIRQKVSFPVGGPAQTPGVIVMVIDDTVGSDADPALDRVVVVFNASPALQPVPVDTAEELRLSPIQAGGSDPVLRDGVQVDGPGGTVWVPARSVAVFVQPQR